VLNERERRIFEARRLVDDPIALEDFAAEFGVSRERVRQIEVSAFEKVQKAVKNRVAVRTTRRMKWKTHVHCQRGSARQRGFGFYIGLAVCHERKGIRAIRIDAELPGERTSLRQLDRNQAKIAAAITFAHEAEAARA
jgi:hypothetical protein